jgi:hypothetical protein
MFFGRSVDVHYTILNNTNSDTSRTPVSIAKATSTRRRLEKSASIPGTFCMRGKEMRGLNGHGARPRHAGTGIEFIGEVHKRA